MAEEPRPRVDPRFDPVFQRGYDPEVHAPRERRRPEVIGAPPPARSVPVPVVEEHDDEIEPRNPWMPALLLASLVLIAVAVALTWSLGQRISPNGPPEAMELFLQQLAYQLTPALLIAGVLGVVFWIAAGAIRARRP